MFRVSFFRCTSNMACRSNRVGSSMATCRSNLPGLKRAWKELKVCITQTTGRMWTFHACQRLHSPIACFCLLYVHVYMSYWPSVRLRRLAICQVFFAFLCTETELRSINTQKARPISDHLDRTSLVSKGLKAIKDSAPAWRKFFLRDSAGSPQRAR